MFRCNLRMIATYSALFTLSPVALSADSVSPCITGFEAEAGGWQWHAGVGTTLVTTGRLTVHNPAPRRPAHVRDVDVRVAKLRDDLTISVGGLPNTVRISDTAVTIIPNYGSARTIICGDAIVECPLGADQAVHVDVIRGGKSVARTVPGGATLTRQAIYGSRTDPHYDARLEIDDDQAIVATLGDDAGPVELAVLVADADHQEEHRLFSITFDVAGYAKLQLLADAASGLVATSREREDCRGFEL